MRVALPLTAAANGTVASTRIWPGFRCSRRLVRFSDCARKGTVRMTIGPRVAASALTAPSIWPSGTLSRALRADSSADSCLREPITTGTPALAQRRASPKPSAPVPPMIGTSSMRRGTLLGSNPMEEVRIREVGPRDGFQNEPEVIATEDKVRLIEMLARTGLSRLEITSFVRADVIPQLADAAEVLRAVDVPDGVARSVLIPNEKGLEKALELREAPPRKGGGAGPLFDEVNLFLS